MTTPHRTRAQQRIDAVDISPTKLLAEIDKLKDELAAARKSSDEYLAALQRERAEFQNYKRRVGEERQAMLGLAAESLLSKVLALADDFDRALDARPASVANDPWIEGIAAIDRKLRLLLESEGVTAIDAQPGIRFDPRFHEAIVNIPGSGRVEGEIVDEIRRGYRLRDRVLRPALVAVAEGETALGGPEPDGSAAGNPQANPHREPNLQSNTERTNDQQES